MAVKGHLCLVCSQSYNMIQGRRLDADFGVCVWGLWIVGEQVWCWPIHTRLMLGFCA